MHKRWLPWFKSESALLFHHSDLTTLKIEVQDLKKKIKDMQKSAANERKMLEGDSDDSNAGFAEDSDTDSMMDMIMDDDDLAIKSKRKIGNVEDFEGEMDQMMEGQDSSDGAYGSDYSPDGSPSKGSNGRLNTEGQLITEDSVNEDDMGMTPK